MLFKLVFVGALVFIGFVIGLEEANKLSNRVLFWEEFSAFLVYVKNQVKYSSDSLLNIVQLYSCTPKLSFIKSIDKEALLDKSLAQLWSSAVNTIPKSCGLKKEELDMLKKFGSGLGLSDIDGEVSHCDFYFSLCEQSLREAQKEKQKKYKLYQILGVSVAVCLALIFI